MVWYEGMELRGVSVLSRVLTGILGYCFISNKAFRNSRALVLSEYLVIVTACGRRAYDFSAGEMVVSFLFLD